MKKILKMTGNESKKIKNNRGITLIALVITIIVLLILAGVSIVTLTGNNGILTQAKGAEIKTRASQVEELVEIWKTENGMNDFTSSDVEVKTEDELLQELLDNKQVFENEIDRENKTITIGDKKISYKLKSELTDIYVALYNDGTLVFNNKNEFETEKIAEGWKVENIKDKEYEWLPIEEEPWVDISKLPQWYNNESVVKVYFLNKIVPKNINFWFYGLSNLSIMENMNNLDTSNVTNMAEMFYECSSLQSIDLSKLDTSKVTNMDAMFSYCSSLQNIDLTGLDTSKVTNMDAMFRYCTSLQNIDLTGLDTSNVTSMDSMFNNCSSLQSIDLTGLDTSNVTSMEKVFTGCANLKNANLKDINVEKVESMQYMFWECSNLESVDVTGWNTKSLKNMGSMFSDCNKLINIDVSEFNTSNVTDMSTTFSNCSALTNIDVSKWDTSKVENMIAMFQNCTGLQKLDVSNFEITYMKENPRRVQRMFKGVTCPITISSEWTDEMKAESDYV